MSLSMFAKRVTMLVFQCDVDNAVLVGATTLPRKDEDSRVALRHYGRTEDHMSRHQVLAPEDGSLDPRAAGAKDERARADRLGRLQGLASQPIEDGLFAAAHRFNAHVDDLDRAVTIAVSVDSLMQLMELLSCLAGAPRVAIPPVKRHGNVVELAHVPEIGGQSEGAPVVRHAISLKVLVQSRLEAREALPKGMATFILQRQVKGRLRVVGEVCQK